MYTDKELKEATQIVYLSFLADAEESLRYDGVKGPYSIMDLIKSQINLESAYKEALANGIDKKNITIRELAMYSNLKDSDKSIIERFSREMFDWKIADISDLNSLNGFVACCIETSEKEAIIAFRGSENMKEPSNMINDWIRADFGLLNSEETRQQEETEKYGEKLVRKGLIEKYNSLAVTGHSLGGNLATHFTIAAAKNGKEELFDKINQTINFDGPGVSELYLNKHKNEIEKAAPKLKRYKWSAVGTLLFDIPGEDSEFLDINDDLYKDDPKKRIKYKLITRHNTKSLLFDENGMAKRGKQDIVSKGLSVLSKAVDKFLPPIITTEIFAAADWVFERLLRVSENRNIQFNDPDWAERFAKKGSVLASCVNFLNKTIDTLREGALELQDEIIDIFTPAPKLKLAYADVIERASYDNHFNISTMKNSQNMIFRKDNEFTRD